MEKVELNTYFKYDRNELFSVLLDLLSVFDDLCKKYNLKYFAEGGTMLGAVRHNGFIPWDDDIDLAMRRDDFDTLLKIIENEKLPEPYKFLTPITDIQYAKGLVRLCNTNTTAISINNAIYKYNHGIFVDIFPLDEVPDNRIQFAFYKTKVNALKVAMASYARYDIGSLGKRGLTLKKALVQHCCDILFRFGLLRKKELFDCLCNAAAKYNHRGNNRLCLSTFNLVKKHINYISDYEGEIIEIPFETTTIPVPKAYDRILRHHYGNNYMIPVKESTYHGDTLFSTKIPYKEFMEMYHDELEDLWIKYCSALKKKR